MKSIWNFIGIILFWLAWPIWSIYLHIVPGRSRVLVVFNDEVLLVKSWLSTGKWMMPGGGANQDESMEASAIRELEEEVGIVSAETALRPLGKHSHNKHGLSYVASYFILELEDKPDIKKRWPEISEARWHKFTNIRGHMLDDDAAYALKQYEPIGQTELL